jgi:hypothetical protein
MWPQLKPREAARGLDMGYYLNALGNLPVDKGVHLYVFVLGDAWHGSDYEKVEKNFPKLAREIGSNAVIAMGLEPNLFREEVGIQYFGADWEARRDEVIPGFLVTDAHPNEVQPDSMCLCISMAKVNETFDDWPNFFKLLTQLARGEDRKLIDKLDGEKKGRLDWVDGAVDLKIPIIPGVLSVNVNKLINKVRGAELR